MSVGAVLGRAMRLGPVVVGVEAGQLHQRVPLPLVLHFLVEDLVRGDEGLGTAGHVIDREQVVGERRPRLPA